MKYYKKSTIEYKSLYDLRLDTNRKNTGKTLPTEIFLRISNSSFYNPINMGYNSGKSKKCKYA